MKNLQNLREHSINIGAASKMIKILLLACIIALPLTSCFEDLDDTASSTKEINDFIWKGMNAYYLYNKVEFVPDLTNERFGINGLDNRYGRTEEYTDYLKGFSSPEALFESLRYLPLDPVTFSRIYSNYFDIQNQQQGITLSNGIEFNLYRFSEDSDQVFGAITLVLNNSLADDLGLLRGQVFRAVDDVLLTEDNINQLLNQDTYTLNFADYDNNGTLETEDDTITLNGESETLTKVAYTENPIHKAITIDLDNNVKVGYLMYNGFNRDYNDELNNVFADFQADGVNELVLDLRYNGGGSIQTAAYLGSMITGQFTEEIFSKTFYNDNFQSQNRNYLFTNTIEGGGAINSLNLSKIYVLTTNRRTASASELVINSLKPYIDVVVIGENTVGKTQASITIYDSPNFSFEGVNPSHTYAMQPLVANSTNVNDQLVPIDGMAPDFDVTEAASTFRVLGNIEEPLLFTAISEILGIGRPLNEMPDTQHIISSNKILPFEQDMYID